MTRRAHLTSIPIIAIFLMLPFAAAEDDRAAKPVSCSRAEMDAYLSTIRYSILEHWRATTPVDEAFGCVVELVQNFRGEVLNVTIDECADSPRVHKAIEDAAYLLSPIAIPANKQCFERTVKVRLFRRDEKSPT